MFLSLKGSHCFLSVSTTLRFSLIKAFWMRFRYSAFVSVALGSPTSVLPGFFVLKKLIKPFLAVFFSDAAK